MRAPQVEGNIGEEARESGEDVRLRQRGEQMLASYRAPSCAAAIDKIETLLRPLQGRWSERTPAGTLPAELAAVLVQAELWGSQSTSVCRDDPAAPRFAALRSLMTTIWRYPKQATRAELEQQLLVLRADQQPASANGG